MKGVIAVVMLAVGVVLGFTAGLLIRDPSVIAHPRTLLQDSAPTSCLQVVRAADEMSRINHDYLALVRQSYLPMLQQRSEQPAQGTQATTPAPPAGSPPTAPAVDAMVAASQRLADLGDRTDAATAMLDESRGQCESRVGP